MGTEPNPSREKAEAEKRTKFFGDMRAATSNSYQTPLPVILLRYRQHASINMTREECLLVITLHSYSSALDDLPFVGNETLRDELGYTDTSQIRKLARSLRAKALVYRQAEDRRGRAFWALAPLWAKLAKLHGDIATARQTREEIEATRLRAVEDRNLVKVARSLKPVEDTKAPEISRVTGDKSPRGGHIGPDERAIKTGVAGFKDPLLSSNDIAPSDVAPVV